jgi:hypothetical protein
MGCGREATHVCAYLCQDCRARDRPDSRNALEQPQYLFKRGQVQFDLSLNVFDGLGEEVDMRHDLSDVTKWWGWM